MWTNKLFFNATRDGIWNSIFTRMVTSNRTHESSDTGVYQSRLISSSVRVLTAPLIFTVEVGTNYCFCTKTFLFNLCSDKSWDWCFEPGRPPFFASGENPPRESNHIDDDRRFLVKNINHIAYFRNFRLSHGDKRPTRRKRFCVFCFSTFFHTIISSYMILSIKRHPHLTDRTNFLLLLFVFNPKNKFLCHSLVPTHRDQCINKKKQKTQSVSMNLNDTEHNHTYFVGRLEILGALLYKCEMCKSIDCF